jgi:hypothetical protein
MCNITSTSKRSNPLGFADTLTLIAELSDPGGTQGILKLSESAPVSLPDMLQAY